MRCSSRFGDGLSNHVPSAEVSSVSQAVERVRKQLQNGADGVKIFAASFAGGGTIIPMPLDIAKSIVAEAHRAGKPAFAHPSNMEGIEIAVQSGVDVLAHTAPLAGALIVPEASSFWIWRSR